MIASAPAADQAQLTDQVQSELEKSFSSVADTAARYPRIRARSSAGAQQAFLDGQKWAYTAGIVAITGGALLIARMYPKHIGELQLLDEYHRIDGMEPAAACSRRDRACRDRGTMDRQPAEQEASGQAAGVEPVGLRADLVLEGGGVKGIGLVGAISVLEAGRLHVRTGCRNLRRIDRRSAGCGRYEFRRDVRRDDHARLSKVQGSHSVDASSRSSASSSRCSCRRGSIAATTSSPSSPSSCRREAFVRGPTSNATIRGVRYRRTSGTSWWSTSRT